MSRKRGSGGTAREKDIIQRAEWIATRLDEHIDGMHRLGEPAVVLDTAWHPSMDAVYREFDGAELFQEAIVLVPATEVRAGSQGFVVGECEGSELVVGEDGRVWLRDEDLGELLPAGTRFDRWLAGAICAQELLFGSDGEFKDGLFDDEGEPLTSTRREQLKQQLKRDPHAVLSRWQLARIEAEEGELERARDILESVVEDAEAFAWAWYDMARVSEALGAFEAAADEAEEAARRSEGSEFELFFLGHAARLADLSSQEDRARMLAAELSRKDPEIVERNRRAARELLDAGERDRATEMLQIARVVSPRDLQTLELLRQATAPAE